MSSQPNGRSNQGNGPGTSEAEPDLGAYMDDLATDAKGWYEAQRAYLTLVASERAGKLSAMLLIGVVSALMVGAVLLMCSIALALWLGRELGDNALGFLTVGGIFLLAMPLFYLIWRYLLRDRITLALINAMHGND